MTRKPEENLVPAYVRLHASINSYWQNVLRPALAGIVDDGALAIFLNHQIGQWEIEGAAVARQPMTPERDSNHTHILHVIVLLKDTLAALVLRIRARIAVAEAALGKANGERT